MDRRVQKTFEGRSRVRSFCRQTNHIDQFLLGNTTFFTVNERHIDLHMRVQHILEAFEETTTRRDLLPTRADTSLLGRFTLLSGCAMVADVVKLSLERSLLLHNFLTTTTSSPTYRNHLVMI